MKSRYRYLSLSLFSAFLLSISWYWNLSICLFFAFVPLLMLEDDLKQNLSIAKSNLKLFLFTYLTFFTWNIAVTWWVVYASFGGASVAFILNALLMSFVFLIFSNLKTRIQKPWAVWLFIPLWLAWEHIHTLWDLSWTWLTLGNAFAFNHHWIQWYEFTGTSGGTLWALAVNIFIFQIIKQHNTLTFFSKPILKIATAIVLPILISYAILFIRTSKTNPEKPLKILVVQPNIDPYNVKFLLDYQTQFNNMLTQIRGKVNSETDFLVLPETFITEEINEANIQHNFAIHLFKDSLLAYYPNLKIITGANTYEFYEDARLITSTAREDKRSGKYYDFYNSALYISASDIQIYHKSKLVPGVERMPFPALLKPLEGLAINMGGTMGSLGIQKERVVFKDSATDIGIAPVICYESVYADYLTEYIRKGAGLIFIITNDGWWDDTPGYIQHLNYARMRAIENRRAIARCANTGVSCFLDEFGTIYKTTNWWQPALIEKELKPNHALTFFSRYGDILSYMSVIISIFSLFWLLFKRFKK